MTAHTKASQKLSFSVNLETQSLFHIQFLKAVDSVAAFKQPQVLRRALYRYEKFWLPLAAAHQKEKLSGPLDVEWVWHCHMLSPRNYASDCQNIVNLVVDHTLKSARDFRASQDKARSIWSQIYPTEPFEPKYNEPFDYSVLDTFDSTIPYDIIAAASRQGVFYYQVSLPHFKDDKFLKNALKRYKQFLYLKTQLPKEFLVPCYDIDLIWHSHQLNPIDYGKDMNKIIGNLFNHDDTVNDRSEGSKLSVADNQTRAHWKSFYSENFALFGAMYRGMPPAGFLYKVTMEDVMTFCTKKCDLTIKSIILQHPEMSEQTWKRYCVTCSPAAGNKLARRWFKLSGGDGHFNSQERSKTWSNLGTFPFYTKKENNLMLDVQEKIGYAFCSSKTAVGKGTLNMLGLIESRENGNNGTLSKTLELGQGSLDVKGHVTQPERDVTLLFLETGRYETSVIPENIKQLWGPVALERLPAGVDNKCQVATHG